MPSSRRVLASKASFPIVFLALAGLAACSTGGGGNPLDQDAARAGEDAGPHDGGPSSGGATIEIMPATVDVTVSPDTPRVVDLHAFAVARDGTRTEVTGTWMLADTTIGRIEALTGRLTLNGERGGETVVTVSASLGAGLGFGEASAPVHVRVESVVLGPGVDDTLRATVDAADATGASAGPAILYPLDGTIMPSNLAPPDVQWDDQGTAGDVFRVAVRAPRAAVVAYVRHTGAAFDYHWLVDRAGWIAMGNNAVDVPIHVELARYSPADAKLHVSSPITLTLANAVLSGSVYYWSVTESTIFRVDDGSATRVTPIPSPPAAAFADRGNCIGCHEVSQNGRYMTGRLGGYSNSGVVFDLTDPHLTDSPAATTFPITTSGPQWFFSSWSKDNDVLVVDAQAGGLPLRFVNPFTGETIPPTAGSLPTRAAQPRWAPDGSAIAYSGEATGDYDAPLVVTDGDLYVVPTPTPRSLGTPVKLVEGTTLSGQPEGGSAIGRATWSPDAQMLVFFHGPYTSANPDTSGTPGRSAIYAVSALGGMPVRLDNAMGGPARTDAFWPNFAPFYAGGYYWLSFESQQEYGNAHVGTRGHPEHQIWVTALTPLSELGETHGDPSHPAYWLPGQDVRSHSVTANWTARACRANDESCELDGQCCSGRCTAGQCGSAEMCHGRGEACGGDEDCCTSTAQPLVCIANSCQPLPI